MTLYNLKLYYKQVDTDVYDYLVVRYEEEEEPEVEKSYTLALNLSSANPINYLSWIKTNPFNSRMPPYLLLCRDITSNLKRQFSATYCRIP